jgi:hypothetical protein
MATGGQSPVPGVERLRSGAVQGMAVGGGAPAAALPGGTTSWHDPSPRAVASAVARRRRQPRAIAALMLTGLAVLASARWLADYRAITSPPVAAPSVRDAFIDDTRVNVSISVPGGQLPWVTTPDALVGDVALWRRMHLADWNRVPEPLREAGLEAMLRRYREVLTSPSAWDRMNADDWDLIPQPIRTVAFRHMTAYWAGYYDLGAAHGLPRHVMSDTLAAIVMSESWFDHRAIGVNRDGTRDVGLAGASEFARLRLRELHASELVDLGPEDEAYFDPWVATRFAAVWLGLLMDEADGHVDHAIGAYNRGIAGAGDALGLKYTATVHRRRSVFIRNQGSPPAWDYVWRRAREIERRAWPWMRLRADEGAARGGFPLDCAVGAPCGGPPPADRRGQPREGAGSQAPRTGR